MEPPDEASNESFESFKAENLQYFNDLSENKEICFNCTKSVISHKDEDISTCHFVSPW